MAEEMVVHEEQKSYEITDLQNTSGALATITKAEIDTQIATAHQYKRSLTDFRKKAMTMLMMNQDIAEECFYVIPRAGKTIEGPSVRLAEIVASAYGNIRSGARVVAEEGDFVVAQGVCHDLENNVAITFEVKRRITTRSGQRFDSDMIGVTGNAASSIAFRNTVFRVVPKVLWLPLYEAARKVARGDEKTFEVKREAVLIGFEKIKVSRKKVFDYLGINGIEDMNSDHLVTLIGIGNAIKNGEANVRDFDPEPATPRSTKPEPTMTNTPNETTTSGSMFETAEPLITQEQGKKFWDDAFEIGWKKSEVTEMLKKEFNIEAIKDLKQSQLPAVMQAIQSRKK